MDMAKRLTLTFVAIAVLATSSAFANTITVGVITHVDDGSGGQLWTYPIVFNNSAIDASQSTSFDLNDLVP